MKRAAIYCRVSTDRQRERHTISSQRRILPALALSKGYTISDQYIDDGISGEALRNMPELRRLLDDAELGRFDAVFVIDIDRITRFSRESERALVIDICTENGIKIYTPDQRYILGNRNDRLQFGIKGAVSLYEKETIRERCRRGQVEKRAQGQWMGGTPPAGYRYNRSSRALELDPTELPGVRRILALAETETAREIARQVPGYTPRMIRRILEAPRLRFYAGMIELGNGETIKAQWQAIIDQSQMARILSAKTARNAAGGKSTQATHLLTGLGLVRCGYCGRSLKAWHDRKLRKSGKVYDKAYYRCTSVQDVSGPCKGSKMMSAELMENKIMGCLEKTLKAPELLRRAFAAANATRDDIRIKIEGLRGEIIGHQTKKRNLLAAIEAGVIDIEDARERMDVIKGAVLVLERQIEKIESAAPRWDPAAIDALIDLDPTFADFHETRAVIKTCFKKIKVFSGNIYLEFQFPVSESGGFFKRLVL